MLKICLPHVSKILKFKLNKQIINMHKKITFYPNGIKLITSYTFIEVHTYKYIHRNVHYRTSK